MTPYSYPGLIESPTLLSDAISKVQAIPQFQGVTASEIMGKSRIELICNARHVFRFFLYCKLRNYLRMARILNAHHTTIIHSVSYVEDLKITDKKLRALIDELIS
jgi:chromosomal replication initiation ATPase DnaA